MSQHVQKLFDAIAPRYDLLNSLLSLKTDRRWRDQAVSKLKEDRFREVLDLCAGTLALTVPLLKKNPRVHVTAVDFSEAMLKEGEARLPYAFRSRVTCLVADAMKLEEPLNRERRRVALRSERSGKGLPDEGHGERAGSLPIQFDAVMCAYGMRNVDNNQIVLEKIKEILKPGGKLVVLEFFKPEGLLSQLFNVTYAEIVIPVLGKIISNHPNAYHYLRDSVRNFYTPTAYRELLKSIGFENIQMKAQTGGISHLITAEIPK